jgi:hypothetical protein
MRSSFPGLVLAVALAACTVGERGSRRPRPEAYRDDLAPVAASRRETLPPEPGPRVSDPGVIPGTPSYRVVWEALYVEQERYRNSKFRPTDAPVFGQPDFEVILLNSSFVATPEQDRENRSQTAVGRIARVSDRDMLDLVAALEGMDFFKYAHATDAVRPYFGSDRARGRVTVEKDGRSVTLISYRGLGLQDSTKAIPQIYSWAKYAIQRLKNSTPTMSVKGAQVAPLRPPPNAGSGADGGGSPPPRK